MTADTHAVQPGALSITPLKVCFTSHGDLDHVT